MSGAIVGSLNQHHARLEDARCVLARVNDQLAASPDNPIFVEACAVARRQYLDASVALLAAIDPPAPVSALPSFRFTTGAVARQMHGASVVAGQVVVRMGRERAARREARRRFRA